MFNQYEARIADIPGNRIMNPSIAALRRDAVIECGATKISEAALLSMARLGNGDAFVALCKLHSNRILPTVYNITRNRHDAEDALQSAILRAFSHLKDFQEKSTFSTWLTRIAINSALMILRKKRSCHEIPLEGSDDSGNSLQRSEIESAAESPEIRYARLERQELLKDAILRLPQPLREVVDLQVRREYSSAEIAQILGISVAAVKSRLARARTTLRTISMHGRSRKIRPLRKKTR
jgi:RNA polymerase sigma-70 factor, ECF subfamily